ncbi:MAG: PilZ domain-containing protein [Candidatus Omnitrophica bacterium]|nr:PilZ domain-containing protein [Candidatus Omnitrophota bacterium]
MEERRQFARLDTRIEVTCRAVTTAPPQRMVTKNVSAGGICIFVEQELAPGTHLEVSMTLPDRPKPVQFTGEVVWSEAYEIISKTHRKRAVEAGIKFIAIDPKALDALMQYVILAVKPRPKP